MTKNMAVFTDIDNTLISGTGLNLLAKFAAGKKMIPFSTLPWAMYWYLLYKTNRIKDFRGIIRKTASLLKPTVSKFSADEIDQTIAECFEQKIKPRIYPDAVSLLKKFHEEGYLIHFISSTVAPLASQIQEYFGFGSIIATEMDRDGDHYTGFIQGKICYGQEKLEQILTIAEQKDIDLNASFAFSDHISDAPMLNLVGHPVVINPDKKLQEMATLNHWEVQFFSL